MARDGIRVPAGDGHTRAQRRDGGRGHAGGNPTGQPGVIALGGGPYHAFAWQASTLPQSVPFALTGLVLLGLWSYLVTLVAGADATVSRSLLFSGGPEERLRAELTEVAASRARLADAFEAERRRIERDLHDGAQQKLVALTMQLGLARLDLPPGPAARAVTAAHEQAKQLMADLRDLIHGIQPQVLPTWGWRRRSTNSPTRQRFPSRSILPWPGGCRTRPRARRTSRRRKRWSTSPSTPGRPPPA